MLLRVGAAREYRVHGHAVAHLPRAQRDPGQYFHGCVGGGGGRECDVLGRGRPAAAQMAANTRSLAAMQVLLKRTMQAPLQDPRSGPARQDPSGSRVFP